MAAVAVLVASLLGGCGGNSTVEMSCRGGPSVWATIGNDLQLNVACASGQAGGNIKTIASASTLRLTATPHTRWSLVVADDHPSPAGSQHDPASGAQALRPSPPRLGEEIVERGARSPACGARSGGFVQRAVRTATMSRRSSSSRDTAGTFLRGDIREDRRVRAGSRGLPKRPGSVGPIGDARSSDAARRGHHGQARIGAGQSNAHCAGTTTGAVAPIRHVVLVPDYDA